MHLARFPRVFLAHLPTPLERLDRLTAELGGPEIWIKRDDCTGLVLGGNKARHNEFLLGDALGHLDLAGLGLRFADGDVVGVFLGFRNTLHNLDLTGLGLGFAGRDLVLVLFLEGLLFLNGVGDFLGDRVRHPHALRADRSRSTGRSSGTTAASRGSAAAAAGRMAAATASGS